MNHPNITSGSKRALKAVIRKAKIMEAFASGKTYSQIGQEFGITRQRVQQIIRPPIQVLDALRRRANNACERCKIPLRLGQGHTHHVNRDVVGKFSDIEKLRYLCPSCHRFEETPDQIDQIIPPCVISDVERDGYLSISAFAKRTRKFPSYVYSMIYAGKIEAKRDQFGKWCIPIAEAERINRKSEVARFTRTKD